MKGNKAIGEVRWPTVDPYAGVAIGATETPPIPAFKVLYVPKTGGWQWYDFENMLWVILEGTHELATL